MEGRFSKLGKIAELGPQVGAAPTSIGSVFRPVHDHDLNFRGAHTCENVDGNHVGLFKIGFGHQSIETVNGVLETWAGECLGCEFSHFDPARSNPWNSRRRNCRFRFCERGAKRGPDDRSTPWRSPGPDRLAKSVTTILVLVRQGNHGDEMSLLSFTRRPAIKVVRLHSGE